MPCKNAVIPYLDELTPAAKAIQAVNTIVNENGRLVGHNTDGCGYTQNLRRSGAEVSGKKIVLLGGGGAASAIAIQAALEGAAEIAVFNRRDEFWPRVQKGLEAISQAAPACRISLRDLDDRDGLKAAIDGCDILSNATRVGMAPYEDQSNITDLTWFRPDLKKVFKDYKQGGYFISVTYKSDPNHRYQYQYFLVNHRREQAFNVMYCSVYDNHNNELDDFSDCVYKPLE